MVVALVVFVVGLAMVVVTVVVVLVGMPLLAVIALPLVSALVAMVVAESTLTAAVALVAIAQWVLAVLEGQCAMVVAALLIRLLSIIIKANRWKVKAATPFQKVNPSS